MVLIVTSRILAGKPTSLNAIISSSNNTHVSVTVSWESPADTVTTGYVIYYQPKTGGPVISESVTGGHRESHSLTGLQRGHTYNISIVALSQHLPSPLVGPVNVAAGEPLNACSLHSLSLYTISSFILSLISSLVGYLSCWSYPVPSIRTATVAVICEALESNDSM